QAQVLFFRDPKRAVHMEIPTLAEDRNGWGLSLDQSMNVRVPVDCVFREAGRSERGEPGVIEMQISGPREELLVLRIRARPATLDVIDTQLVQLPRNQDFVIHGEGNGLALRAVPERRIESGDPHYFAAFTWSRLPP